jgi:glycosyltransferase involved in cell wall biosynthesis
MRIGIMLRHYAQHRGGVRVYTRELLKHLFMQPREHEYVLYYSNPSLLGTHGGVPNVTEVNVPGQNVLWWDQVALPRELRQRGVDVLFNPKYSVPLTGSYPSAWVCHGLDWYVMPWASRYVDRLSHRYLVPRYAARSSAIVAVSEVTKNHLIEFLRIPADRIAMIYTGVGDEFWTGLTADQLGAVRERYKLPQRYVLYAGAVYPPKNFRRLVQAYAKVGPELGVSLVIAGGTNRFLSADELKEPERLGLGDWVRWAGWVDSETLPAFYQMAEALLLPSLFESFGLPIVEAMASSCPVVTSNCYGAKEVAGDAAVLVEPRSVDSIADGVRRVLTCPELRQVLTERGLRHSRAFTWERCAGQTLDVLERIGGEQRPSLSPPARLHRRAA